MKRMRRMEIAIIMAVILLTSLLLFACNDADTKNAPTFTNTDLLSGDAVSTPDTNPDATIDEAETDESEGAESEDRPESDQRGEGTQSGGELNLGEQGSGPESEKDGAPQQTTGEDAVLPEENNIQEEKLWIERDGYYRLDEVTAEGEWFVAVGSSVIGNARISADGVFTCSAFSQSEIELWGKVNSEYEDIDIYFYFDALSEYRAVTIRKESMLVQIQLTADELALLIPTPEISEQEIVPSSGDGAEQESRQEGILDDSLSEEAQGNVSQNGDAVGEAQSTDSLSDGGTQQNQESGTDNVIGEIQGDEDEDIDSQEQGNNQSEANDLETSEQSNGGDEMILEQAENAGGSGGGSGSGESDAAHCTNCGALLASTSLHLSTCSHYAVLPVESDAYDWIAELPGMREDLDVTALDEANEIYSFFLNYLTEIEVDELLSVMRTYKTYEEPGKIHAQIMLGTKKFTFVTDITQEGTLYKASIHLMGFFLK